MIIEEKTKRQWKTMVKRSQVIQTTEVRNNGHIYPMIIRTLENSCDTYTAAVIYSHIDGKPDTVFIWEAREEDFIR